MKTLLFTNEYPPAIYGGAGIHVDYLSRELARLCEVEVRCFGTQNIDLPHLKVYGTSVETDTWTAPKNLHPIFDALSRNLAFNTKNIDADLVHLHTWYSHFAGILAKINYGTPIVITVHSLEPLRPWKREQLGGGYDFTVWLEKTAIEMADAIIAVSQETREDILQHFSVPDNKIHVIHNGIDLQEYQVFHEPDTIRQLGVNPDVPYVLFVGRITRQKGIIYLVNAIKHLHPDIQVVLCAGAPDTPEIAAEMSRAVASLGRDNVIWIEKMLDRHRKVVLYSHAALFCCPSIYEPFGIINLEAMACHTAVVASAVGGMKEVIVHGETGLLVPVEQYKESPFTPTHPEQFSLDLAAAINELMSDPERRQRMSDAGRKRVEELFSWERIAAQTFQLYQKILAKNINQTPSHAT